ncbi:poly [ADP-ribose] polymerase 2 isoform X2 [Spinacia oleracea]|uniref:Poly [ADP-ribose] polymerase n=1 Tax=Spinacia oleracea TaxID=3562 RepID=A0A9R0JM05_SPIOL|nr:poly [ADP-ribose] polymerase 2 isoform X2 [Spinacia oleracea]
MASNMKVDELRAELSKRDLDTSGTKPTLVKRLESALRKETKQLAAKDESGSTKKRDRENDDSKEIGNVVDEIGEIERFQGMTVQKLRKEASIRGLSTSGTKKELVQRLCDSSAVDGIGKGEGEKQDEKVVEEVKNEDEINDESKEIGTGSDEISAFKKLQGMSIQKLRKEASIRGVSSSGTKKELVQRLCDSDAIDGYGGEGEEDNQDKKVVEEVKKEKLVKATKKGSAVLDQWLPDHIKSSYHVLEMGDAIYDAMLNQTNVGDNNNKFYMIQVLEVDGGGTYMVYNRWGRVGVKGQDKLFGPYSCRETAIQEFEQKFLAKTKNYWSNRKVFVSYPKCYTWLEMDYSEKDQDQEKPSSSCTNIQPQESKLEPRIAKFISLICNISMMRQQMMEIGYNAEKLPLGKLSKSTILKGYDVLKRLSDVIGQSDRKLVEQLSGEFYTVIPHDFGFKKMREFVIDTPQKLKSKLEMVEALSEIELATKLLSDDVGMQDDLLYAQYGRLNCELMPVEVDSEEFSMIQKYTKNTHAKTHSNYTVDINQVFRVSRGGENEQFKKFASTKNRMLLWHGSRLTNWTGILSQGLRIAPPEAPVTGYMFGKGVYFADMFSKSANYCYSSSSAPTGVLLLCEVALGEMEELLHSNYSADKLPAGKLSTKGVGSTAPDMSEAQVLDDGVVVPSGKPVQKKDAKGSLLYNEYIVYNVDQIRMRYVIQVKFNHNR